MRQCKNEDIRTVVVLGAGRSGTSLLCGVLSILGVDFGKGLIPADASNPRGYFESAEFINLNESIYLDLKNRDDMHALSFSEIKPYLDSRSSSFKRILDRLLYSRTSRLYGLKAWRSPLIELSLPHVVNPVFVVIDRELEDTAKSLELHLKRRRNHRVVSLEECMEITKEYHEATEKIVCRHSCVPCIRVTFEEIIHDIESVTYKLADFLSVPVGEGEVRSVKKFVLPSKEERLRMARKATFLLPFKKVYISLQKTLQHTK